MSYMYMTLYGWGRFSHFCEIHWKTCTRVHLHTHSQRTAWYNHTHTHLIAAYVSWPITFFTTEGLYRLSTLPSHLTYKNSVYILGYSSAHALMIHTTTWFTLTDQCSHRNPDSNPIHWMLTPTKIQLLTMALNLQFTLHNNPYLTTLT